MKVFFALAENLLGWSLGICLGRRRGARQLRHIHRRLRIKRQVVPWDQYKADPAVTVIDTNVAMTDNYCPICDTTRQFDTLADNVGCPTKPTRKVLYQCSVCNFLCTNHDRVDRHDYFVYHPRGRANIKRTRREAELVNIAARILGADKQAPVLIYGLGFNDTLSALEEQRYTNVWGSDIAGQLPYGERFINVAEQPQFFADQNLKFEIVVAVEVWEHYERKSINESFKGIFDHITPSGMVIGSTSLWSAQKDNPDFDGPDEWGRGQLRQFPGR